MKTALITGGSSGIGRATALAFAGAGYQVAISYNKNKTGAQETLKQIEVCGVPCIMIEAELSSEENAKALVEAVLEKFKSLDVLVNNAGGYIDGDEWNIGTDDIWTRTLQQNLVSAMNVSKYVVQHFMERKAGVMVNVASRHGLSGQDDALAYAAAKAGIINITQAYAKLLAPFGRANAVSPGAVNTGYWLTAPQNELDETLIDTPTKKLVEPEEIAEAILYLASNQAISITGHNLVVDGGYVLK